MEPTVTPIAQATPNYYLDQIDIAVELPMGLQGEQGPPGTKWMVGPGDPPLEGEYDEGTMFLAGSGIIYEYENGEWENTGVDLIPDITQMVPHEHPEYLPLTGGTLTGPLFGGDASFNGNVVVPTPNVGNEAVNVDYLTNEIKKLNLQKFFGDVVGNAISTGLGGWNSGQQQAIYQYTGSLNMPPGTVGPTVGLTMKQSNGNSVQLICDVARNIWFTRSLTGNTYGSWSTVTPIVQSTAPVDPPNGPPVPHGTIWIQTDSTVIP